MTQQKPSTPKASSVKTAKTKPSLTQHAKFSTSRQTRQYIRNKQKALPKGSLAHGNAITVSVREYTPPPPPPPPPGGFRPPPPGSPFGRPGMPPPPPPPPGMPRPPGMPPPPPGSPFGRPGMPPPPGSPFGRPGMPPPPPGMPRPPGMPPPPPGMPRPPGMPPPPPGMPRPPGMPPPPPGAPFGRPGMPPPPPGMPRPPGMPQPPRPPGQQQPQQNQPPRPPAPPHIKQGQAPVGGFDAVMGGFNDDTIPQTSPAGTAQQASADKVTQASSQAQFSRILSALNPNQLPKHALSGSQASAIPDKNMSYTDRFANLVADNKFGANYELEKMKILVSKIGESIKKPTTRTQLNSELALIPPEYKDDPVYFKRTFPKLTSHIEVLEEKIAERTAELKVLEEQQREIETKRKLIELENKNAIPLKPMQTIASLAAISRTSARKIIDLMREIEDVPRTALALISAEQAELVLTTLGKKVRMSGFDTTVDGASMVAIDEEELILGETQFEPRAPVVTIVGHVDHGKTTLLDSLRKTSVAKHEAGRITQSIGGFNVDIPQELKEFIPSITFLDTPGHAIFKHMRARGTNKGLADLAVLLVAATDGVQPMTKESAQMIQQSGIPHVVAITKVDVQGSSPKKAMEELWTQCGIKTTHIGGDVPSIEVSALKGIGLEELVEQIAMTATDKDIFFKPRRDFNTNTVQEWNRHARSIAKSQPIQLHVLDTNNQIEGEVTEIEDMALGYAYVVESKNTHGGAYVDVIVRQGSIKVGDPVVCGLEFGTVRSITNSNGESIQEASGRDSTPVRILGLTPKDITALGEDIIALPTRELAESIAERRDYETMAQDFLTQMDIENNTVREKVIPQRHQVGRRSRALQIRGSARDQAELEAEENKTIYVSLKADVKGTLDALLSYVDDLEASPHAHHVVVKVVKAALGPEITRDDVDFAHTRGNVHILGFNTKITNKIQSYAGEHKVEMFASDVIFDVFDEFRKLLSTKLPTTPQDTVLGSAIIQQMFPIQQSRLQLKRLAVEASLSISGDPVPIVGVPQVLGSRVLSGEIVRMGQAAGDLSQVYWRIRRPNTSAGGRDEYVHQDLQCLSIRHFKDQVQKVAKGQECGIMLNQCDGALPGDFLECYRVKYVHEQFDDSIARGFNRNEEPEWKKWSQQ